MNKNILQYIQDKNTDVGGIWHNPQGRQIFECLGETLHYFRLVRAKNPGPEDFRFLLSQRQDAVGKAALGFVEKAYRGGDEEFDLTLQFAEWFYLSMRYELDGRNMFDFSPRLLEMLMKTDLDASVSPKDIRPPFDFVYIFMNDFATYRGDVTGHNFILEGAFVEALRDSNQGLAALTVNPVTRIGQDYFVWYHFLGIDAPSSLKEYLANIAQGRYSTREDEESHLTSSFLELVFNCLLYLNFLDRDVKYKYPDDIPGKLKEAIQRGKKTAREKAAKAAASLGYSRVYYCGYALQREYEAQGGKRGELTEAHWRRGHWRNQAHGPGHSLRKLIWLRPTIVKREKGEPEKGHIYKVRGEQS